MVYLIGASSLDHTIKHIPYYQRRPLTGSSYTIKGLSFNPNAVNKLKILQNLLSGRGVLARKQKIIIWHDVINNTISKHRSNRDTECSISKLKEILIEFRHRIEAIIYCRRGGTNDIWNELIQTRIPIVDVKRKLLSHRKSNTQAVRDDLEQVHPSLELESRLLQTVWKKRNCLPQLIKKKKQKKNKPSQKERRKKQKRNQQH